MSTTAALRCLGAALVSAVIFFGGGLTAGAIAGVVVGFLVALIRWPPNADTAFFATFVIVTLVGGIVGFVYGAVVGFFAQRGDELNAVELERQRRARA